MAKTAPRLPALISDEALEHLQPPELPDRMVWTSSSIKTFRACPREFYWKYIWRLRPRRTESALMIGTLFHEALGTWYASKRNSMERITDRILHRERIKLTDTKALYDEGDFDSAEKSLTMVGAMLKAYAIVYKDDRETWGKGDTEKEFVVSYDDFDYRGSIDVNHGNQIVEHKTAGNISETYIDRLAMDTQVRGYIRGAQALGGKPKHVIYNVVKKSKLRRKSGETQKAFLQRMADDYLARPDFYFYREKLIFGSAELNSLDNELKLTHGMMESLRKTGDIADPHVWPINDQACSRFFKTCPYMLLCTQGLDQATAIAFEQGDKLHAELEEKPK